jgi:hypothetical protein
VLPIDVPAISLADLNRLTFNFGERALVGEGSYGRVYRATLSTGEAVAVKRFDNGSASGQSGAEFCEQLPVASRLKCEHFTQLLCYCLELNNRIVVYQFAAMGSLYDILHGKKSVQGAEPAGPVLTWGQRARARVPPREGAPAHLAPRREVQ